VPVDGLDTRFAGDRAQRNGHDHGIVGVADHRDEVRDQVDGQGQVDQEQRQPDPHAARQGGVGCQAA
jgi:hypothetical protein